MSPAHLLARAGAAAMQGARRSRLAYDPSSEAGIVLDMWAAAGVTEAGTGVSSWVSGTGSHDYVQGTDAKRPTYEATGLGGRPCVRFVAANADALRVLSGPSEAAGDWTVVAALDVISQPGTNRYLLDFATGRLIFVLNENPATELAYFDGSFKAAAGSQTGTAIYTWHLATTGAEMFRGTTSLGTGAYAATALGGAASIGASNAANNNYVDARVGRVMLFSGVDSARTTRVRDWMSSHYGIAL